MSEKVYINGIFIKERTHQHGSTLGVKIKVSDFKASLDSLSENDWIQIDINPRKTPTDKQSHTATLNTWKPEKR